jgi:hypothetical protein
MTFNPFNSPKWVCHLEVRSIDFYEIIKLLAVNNFLPSICNLPVCFVVCSMIVF